MRYSLVIFLGGCLCVHPAAFGQSCSQDPGLSNANPQLNPVVCKALDDVFRDYAHACTFDFPINLVKNSDLDKPKEKQKTYGVSAVPKVLLDGVQRTNLASPMRITQNLGMARLLSQVLAQKKVDTFQVSDYIGVTATQNPSLLTQLGIDATLYTASCESTLAANASAQAGFSFAPVTITASLNGSLNSKSNSAISLSVGTFDSPLWVFSTSGENSLYADLLMLAWRVNNHNPSTPLYYLAHAHGITSSQLTNQQLNTSAELNSSLTAGFLAVSSKNSLDVARKVTDALSASFYDTVIDKPQDGDFASVPSVNDLQTAIGSLQLQAPQSGATVLKDQGDRALMTQSVVGVPKDMCEGQAIQWTVADKTPGQTDWTADTLLRAASTVPAIPGCVFTFNLIKASTGNNGFTATPVITGTYQGTSFSLKMSSIAFKSDPFPQFLASPLYDDAGHFTTSNGAKVLSYSVVLAVGQSTAVRGYDSASWSASPITAKCSNGSIRLWPNDLTALTLTPTGNSRITTTLLYRLADAKGDLDPTDPHPLECSIDSGVMAFNDSSNGNQTTRTVSSDAGWTISLPRVKPVLAARQLANTGSSFTFAGTVSAVSDVTILSTTSASLVDGTVVLRTTNVKPDYSILFDPVTLDPAVPHNIVITLTPNNFISGGTSPTLPVPAQAVR